jgi:hypothetical protein
MSHQFFSVCRKFRESFAVISVHLQRKNETRRKKGREKWKEKAERKEDIKRNKKIEGKE